MSTGLTSKQEIVEVTIPNVVSGSLKAEIDAALAVRPAHRIISLSITSTQEFSTAALAIVVIEYLEQ